MKVDFSLVPKDKNHEDNILYKKLKKMDGVHVGTIKGMIFIEVRDELAKKQVQKYLDENKKLFDYAC